MTIQEMFDKKVGEQTHERLCEVAKEVGTNVICIQNACRRIDGILTTYARDRILEWMGVPVWGKVYTWDEVLDMCGEKWGFDGDEGPGQFQVHAYRRDGLGIDIIIEGYIDESGAINRAFRAVADERLAEGGE